jgi:hypothetical protein
MCKGVTEKRHAAKHYPDADHRRGEDGEQAGEERSHHEGVPKRIDPPADRIGQPHHRGTSLAGQDGCAGMIERSPAPIT